MTESTAEINGKVRFLTSSVPESVRVRVGKTRSNSTSRGNPQPDICEIIMNGGNAQPELILKMAGGQGYTYTHEYQLPSGRVILYCSPCRYLAPIHYCYELLLCIIAL